jgi:hypothetical protein
MRGIMSDQIFPPIPNQKLSMDQVVQFLVAVKNKGHDVYQDPSRNNVFIISFGDLISIRLSFNVKNGSCQVQLLTCDNVTHFLDVVSFAQLEKTVSSFAQKITGQAWPCRPTKGRLSSLKPASNYFLISQLVGNAEIDAIFDPYLENKSLIELNNILSFGNGRIADGIRLLGSKKTQGYNSSFTKAGTDAWLKELNVTGEARVMSTKGQHRRFILLSTGDSLILGPSLNAIHKDEAIRLESDSEDKAFFDSEWDKSIPLK